MCTNRPRLWGVENSGDNLFRYIGEEEHDIHIDNPAEELNFLHATASVLSTALQRVASDARLAYLAQFESADAASSFLDSPYQ